MPQVVRDAGSLLALRVEREQLPGELVHRLAGTVLEVVPRLPAELRQGGDGCVGADVARDLPELLVRDVQAVVAAEAEEQVVARDPGDRLRLEAEQLADPVVLVHDVVAGAQVRERLERAARCGNAGARAAAEDLRIGQERQAEIAPDEAAARGRDREQELRALRDRLARLEQPGLDTAEQVKSAQRLTAVREGDNDAVVRPEQRGELVLGLREPARGDRGALRFEGVFLPARQRLELCRPLEVRPRAVELLFPDLPHVVGLPDEVRRPVERRDEIVRDASRGQSLGLVRKRRLD